MDTRPRDGVSPNRPHCAAGIRIEPPPSVACATDPGGDATADQDLTILGLSAEPSGQVAYRADRRRRLLRNFLFVSVNHLTHRRVLLRCMVNR
jgi:hypothetical protein